MGEGEKEEGEVYWLLNARLTTGGSSSVKPIKSKQNGGSVQQLCDLTSNNAAGSGHNSTEQQLSNKKAHSIRFFLCVDTVVNAMWFGLVEDKLLGSSGKSPAAIMKVTSNAVFQIQAQHR